MGLRSKAVFPAALFILLIINSSSSGAPPADDSASGESGGTSPPDTAYRLPEIVVRADRMVRPEHRRSEFIACLDIEKMTVGSRDIPSVLADAVGIRIKQYGGLGSHAAMSIRGSSSSQVQVYLDGVPLNDPYSGIANLADISIGAINRIEIYRGASPVSFGGSAIGGRINLIPARSGRSPEGFDINAKTGLGSFGTQKHSLSMNSAAGPVEFRLFGGYTESSGDFPFPDDNGTPMTPADDEISTRMNNDFSRWNLSGMAGLDIPGIRKATVNFDYFMRESGICGIGSNQSAMARTERERGLGYLKLEPEPFISGIITTGVNLFYSRTGERFSDPEGEIGLSRQKTNNTIKSWGGNFSGKLAPPALPLSLELFLEGKNENYHPVSYMPDTREGPDRKRNSLTSAAAGNLGLLDDRLVLSCQYRTLWNENEFYDNPPLPYLPPTPRGKIESRYDSPRGGIRISLNENLTLKGNIGKYVRIPTFFELFGNIGTVTGNPGLEPEKGINRDIGAVLTAGRTGFIRSFFMEGSYFDNEISNLILFFPNSQRTVRPKNIGGARIRGAEVTLSAWLFSSVNLAANYTFLNAEDRSDIPYYNGNQLASTPSHEGSVKLTVNRGRWSAGWDIHYIGSNFLDKANMQEVPGRQIHGLSLSVRDIMNHFRLTLEGRNLTDNQVRDVIGYPLPGRSFYFTLEYSIEGDINETDK